MIKPQEIRDNILVQLLSPPSPIKLPIGIIKVVKLMGSEFKLYNIDKPVCSQEMGIILDIKMVTGIPITEEWLNRFGFKYRNGYGFKKNNFELIAIKVIGSNGYHLRYQLINIEIEYVHQLQNLYQSITGEELTIKE